MVLVQVMAYGKVNDARVRRKSAKATAKAERERKAAQRDNKSASEADSVTTMNSHASESDKAQDASLPPPSKNVMNRSAYAYSMATKNKEETAHTEDSTTEPSSEEETIV